MYYGHLDEENLQFSDNYIGGYTKNILETHTIGTWILQLDGEIIFPPGFFFILILTSLSIKVTLDHPSA